MFGLCDAADVSAAHVAGLEREETAGERYLVSSTDQYSTLEFAQMASAGGAGGVDLAAWAADEDAQKMAPKKPSTNNAKVSKLLGRPLVAPEASVAAAVASLTRSTFLNAVVHSNTSCASLTSATEGCATPMAALACRDPRLWPWSASSIWNTPIGRFADYRSIGLFADPHPLPDPRAR